MTGSLWRKKRRLPDSFRNHKSNFVSRGTMDFVMGVVRLRFLESLVVSCCKSGAVAFFFKVRKSKHREGEEAKTLPVFRSGVTSEYATKTKR